MYINLSAIVLSQNFEYLKTSRLAELLYPVDNLPSDALLNHLRVRGCVQHDQDVATTVRFVFGAQLSSLLPGKAVHYPK